MEGLSKKKKVETHRHRQQYGDYQRERCLGKVEESKGRTNGDGRRLTWGGKHMIQYTDDVLYNCVSETYIILTNVTRIKSIKTKMCVFCFFGTMVE